MTEPDYPFDLMRLVKAFQISQAIHVATTLGIAELLANGPQASADLAGETATDASASNRLLGASAVAGVFHEDENDFVSPFWAHV